VVHRRLAYAARVHTTRAKPVVVAHHEIGTTSTRSRSTSAADRRRANCR
jgi:hypothetical protein